MKEITEGEAREALEILHKGPAFAKNLRDLLRQDDEANTILSTLITRFFLMEKVLKEILNFAYHPDGCQCEDRFKIAQQALTGKGEGK